MTAFYKRHPHLSFLVLVGLVGFLCYSNTFSNSFQFDDKTSIIQNESIRDLSKVKAIWSFYPPRFVAFLSLAVNYHIHGLDVPGYHIVNLLIHLVSAMLVYWLGLLMLATPMGKGTEFQKRAYPIFASLIFVCHPLHTQAVTYIVQRIASLATLFYLLSLCLFLKARLGSLGKQGGAKPVVLVLLSLLSAVAAMLTKEIAATLPVAVLLGEFLLFRKDWREMKQAIPWILPYILLLPVIPLAFLEYYREQGTATPGGALVPADTAWQYSRWTYLLTQANVIRKYLFLFVVPLGLTLDYHYPAATSLLHGPTLLSILFLSVILYAALRHFKTQRIVSFGILFYFLALLVESSVIPLRDAMFEHRTYLPNAGLVFAGIGVAHALFRRFNADEARGEFRLVGLLICIVLTFGFATYQRNFVWASELTLWQDNVAKKPKNPRAHNNLAKAYENELRPEEAERELRIAVKLWPNYPTANINLAMAAQKNKNYGLARRYIDRAIRLDSTNARAYNILGVNQNEQGKTNLAMETFARAIVLDSSYALPHANLGEIYLSRNQLDSAVRYYENAVRLDTNSYRSMSNLGVCYQRKGMAQKAIAKYHAAMKAKPDFVEPYSNLGNLYGKAGHLDSSIVYNKKALELNPASDEIHYELGLAFQLKGNLKEAETHYREALVRSPAHFGAVYNLGEICIKRGQVEPAKRWLQQARKMNPAHPGVRSKLKRLGAL